MSYEPIRQTGLPPLPKIRQMAMLVDAKNYSQLDLYAQLILRELPDDPHANLACAWVAKHFGYLDQANNFFNKASQSQRHLPELANDLHISLNDFPSEKEQVINSRAKFHLAKAWGFGFGSEMSALMGQAYLAEACERSLIVHWGSNFLYRKNPGEECVFADFFEPFNNLSISDAKPYLKDVYPPKWKEQTLAQENIGKRSGDYAKLSALYYLNRPEALTVSDYYAGVINIKPWVDPSLALSQLSLDQAYRYLAKKYLKPQRAIVEQVNAFIRQYLSVPFVAVHARGSDKDEGYRALTSIPGQTLQCAQQRLANMPSNSKLFLMHYDNNTDKQTAGKEMLLDMLIAARADCFIGLGLSNPSQLIKYFGDFSEDDYILFGENRLKQFNTHLYKTIEVR